MMLSAEQFRGFFIKSFAKSYLPQKLGERNVTARSHNMLWDVNSVIRGVAEEADLIVAGGEPLRLDAVLVSTAKGEPWRKVPMLTAIEHENDGWTFDQEIRKLFAVRAPLKVGITYSAPATPKRKKELLEWILAKLRHEFDLAWSIHKEDPTTEYLILLGDEDAETAAIRWYFVQFSSGQGINSLSFLPC